MTDSEDSSPVPPLPVVTLSSVPPSASTPPLDAVADEDGDWRPLPRAARGIRMAGNALLGLVIAAPLALVGAFRAGLSPMTSVLAIVALALAAAAFGAYVGMRQWASTRWRLDARGLQVRRGRMFQREVFVPRSRVQHLDLERGPIERRYGLATIVVHTAGSRLQALRQAGLAEADAVALRDALVPEAEADDDAV
ncbi:MAG: PH domain-containing protein [Arenimonas sp.]